MSGGGSSLPLTTEFHQRKLGSAFTYGVDARLRESLAKASRIRARGPSILIQRSYSICVGSSQLPLCLLLCVSEPTDSFVEPGILPHLCRPLHATGVGHLSTYTIFSITTVLMIVFGRTASGSAHPANKTHAKNLPAHMTHPPTRR